jgi:hypothetical protein
MGGVVRRIVITYVLFGLACGSSQTDVRGTGPSSFQGTSAIFLLTDVSSPGEGPYFPSSNLVLEMSDLPLSCDGSGAAIPPGRHGLLTFWINKLGPDGIGPGTYSLGVVQDGGTTQTVASFFPYEASCNGLPLPGTGEIHLQRVDDGSAEGDLDVRLYDGTILGGTFAADRCRPVVISPALDGGSPASPPLPLCPWAN